MLKSVDLNPDDNYEESNSDFIHQILGLGKDDGKFDLGTHLF